MLTPTQTFTVTPLTEIATQLAEATGDLNAAVATFNAFTGNSFSVGDTGDITEIAPTNLATTAASDDDAGKYATALALISQLDASDPVATAADIINNLRVDLADGTFSQATRDDFAAAALQIWVVLRWLGT